MKNKRGITLIALIITIVVLIILAGVAINMTIGQNGIFTKAKMAKQNYQNAEGDEQLMIADTVNQIDEVTGSTRQEKDWEKVYEGAIASISNVDISKYKEIRCAFMCEGSQFSNWNEYTVGLIKDSQGISLSVYGSQDNWLRIFLINNSKKLTLNNNSSNSKGWSLTIFTLRIEGR